MGERPMRVMFGASNLAGMYRPVSAEIVHDTLQTAWESGMREFDTAPWYGAGLSERYLASFFMRHPDRAPTAAVDSQTKVHTKVGRTVVWFDRDETKSSEAICYEGGEACNIRRDDAALAWDNVDFFHGAGDDQPQHLPSSTSSSSPSNPPSHVVPVPYHDYSFEGIMRSFEQSQARLKMPIHTLRLHDAETESRFAQSMGPGGAVEALVALKEKKQVRAISLGLNSATFMLRFLKECKTGTFDNVLLANRWNLLDQSGWEVLQECARQGVSVIIAGVFGSGILWGGDMYEYEVAPDDIRQKVRQWQALCDEYKVPLPAVAMQFAFLPSGVTHICLGMMSPDQVTQNVTLLQDTDVPLSLYHDAQKNGLLNADIVLPES